MTYGLWLSTAGLQINDYRQSIMANNLANADTVGFKHDLAVIQERAVESRAGVGNNRFATHEGWRYTHGVLDGLTGGAWVRPTVHTFEQGKLEHTDNPLDLAIEGDGFFAVRDGDQVKYTRDGRLTLNDAGELVMVAGGGRFRVLDQNGEPIEVDTAIPGPINITADGTVRRGDEVMGRVVLFEFADRSSLSKSGQNLYTNHGDPGTTSNSTIKSGYVERSTVNAIKGLAGMITVSRAYQLNANMISLQDQTIGQAVTTVGRIG
ncbi:MAG: flagellar hook-basal body protein [Phycisphaerae bacterium]